MISTPEQQAVFLAQHYWDNFDFRDSAVLNSSEAFDRFYIEYLMVLVNVSEEEAGKSISTLIRDASINSDITKFLLDQAEKYLYHPNSPIRNEMLYEEFVKGALESNVVDELVKVRYQYQYDMVRKNKPGNLAADFGYTFKDGTVSSLYQTPADKMILYFHNPDCPECRVTKEKISASQLVQELIGEGKLTILAIYPDKDIELWKKHYNEYPDNWINVYDEATILMDDEVYDLKAIPTLYLLDGDKSVILRDAPFEEIEYYLNNQQ